MDTCRIRLLGPPQIVEDGKASPIPLRKAVGLIAYLAVEQRAFLREYLAALLWPNLGQERAMANLRRTLSQLRTTLQNGCIVAEGDQILLDRDSVLVDVAQFHELTQHQTSNENVDRFQAAADLYRGDFLEGFNLGDCEEFDDWQDAVRERLRLQFDEVVAKLSEGCLAAGQSDRAIPYARRWLDLDHLNERAHRTLMKAYLTTGRADLARHQYESCMRVLDDEGIEPDELTVALRDEIEAHRPEEAVGEPERWGSASGSRLLGGLPIRSPLRSTP